ncbi:MAG: amidohydrolase [Planctomycetes bacterium]|nr:amidohydrolase [Planctomycetota bacterium]
MNVRRCVVACAVSLGCVISVTANADEPAAWVDENLRELVELYRHFHQSPEVSFEEKETSKRLAAELRAAGAEVTRNIGGHGVVAILKNGDGPMLMLRTDLDALPVTEQTGLAYASKVSIRTKKGVQTGVMHACGHDVHITNQIGVARYLAANKDRWRGTVMFIGQPAEERGAGAKAMLDDGLFKRFGKPDFAVALHVSSDTATGTVGYRAGYALANVDSVDITMRGRGGHGAYPHMTIDPVVQAAHLVIDLQSIVSREIKPIEPAVITVGSIHGGTKHNIIGNECHLQITVRSYSEKVRKQLLSAIRRKAKAAAISAAAPEPVVKISEGTPSLFNNKALVGRVVTVFERVVGKDNVQPAEPSMGGEDFSRYGKAGVPIFMYRLGSIDPKRLKRYETLGQKPPSLHSPLYYPDVKMTLRTGVTTMSSAVLELLKK